jgi:hypothetical protein
MLERLPDLNRMRPIVRTGLRRARVWALRLWRREIARERTQAIAAFACIVACTAVSIDYLITGGPDWNPGGAAYAMEVAPSHAREPAPPPPPARLPVLASLTALAVDEADYRFTSEELLGGPRSAVAFDEPRVPEGVGEPFGKIASGATPPRATAPHALKGGR